jgi:hypothetical protein
MGSDVRAEPLGGSASHAVASASAGGFVVATRRSCRVMALRGTATTRPRFAEQGPRPDGGTGWEGGLGVDAHAPRPLAVSDLLPEGGLLDLGPDTELTVQATVSTREITLVGPATAEACPGGDEAMRLSRGTVTAFPGGGVRPGADVWIATPLGVVRFSDAKIDIAVSGPNAERLAVAVIAGLATFVPAVGVSAAVSPAGRADGAAADPRNDGLAASADGADGAIALLPGVTFVASRPAGAVSRWVRDLVAACARQARVARDAGQLVAVPPDGGRAARSDLAFAHVRARRQARAACEAAWAAGALAPGLLDAALRADLEGADATWKGVPSPPPHPSAAVPSRASQGDE